MRRIKASLLLTLVIFCVTNPAEILLIHGFTATTRSSTSSIVPSSSHHKNHRLLLNHHKQSALYADAVVDDADMLCTSSSSDDDKNVSDDNSTSSMSASVFNLVKACIGAGVLAFPSGVAAFSDVSISLIPASIILTVLGLVSAYSFYSIGRVCSEENASSIGEAWKKTVSEDTSWVVDASCFVTPIGAALSFSIILGDLISSVVSTLGVKGLMATRHPIILLITMLVLYPLCSLGSLAALAPVSIVGVVSSMLTCAFLGFRYFSGAYSLGGGGALLSGLSQAYQPSFGAKGMQLMSPSILILFAMAGTGYMCHFAAPDMQKSLENSTKARFKQFTTIGFGITTLLSILFTSFGFLTFGGASSGLILNNYATNDIGAVFCRLFTAISLIGSYPIVFAGARSAWFSLTQKGKDVSEELRMKTTRIMLSLVTATALLLEDSGFVVSLNGALAGSAIIYVFPAIMFLKSSSKRLANGTLKMTKKLKLERIFNKAMAGLGVALGLCGASVSILSTFFPGVL